MDVAIICLVSFAASGITLFAGFGLGTILMPVLALFFPLDIAIALTAIVHMLNNFFKLILLGKYASKPVLLRFGMPAIAFAFAGAYLLNTLINIQPLTTYTLFNNTYNITPIKLIMGTIILIFVILETLPKFKYISFNKKYLPLGGVLSGFFGGLSGHQGALRSAFLTKCELTKESFIATGVVIACMVDLTRITVYSTHFTSAVVTENITLLAAAVLSAFSGVFIGSRLLKKVTMKTVQNIVSVMLLLIGVLLLSGIV